MAAPSPNPIPVKMTCQLKDELESSGSSLGAKDGAEHFLLSGLLHNSHSLYKTFLQRLKIEMQLEYVQ